MNDFSQSLLGGISVGQFLAFLFFALVGSFISLLLHSTDRNVESKRTPMQFSWKFLIRDNWKRSLTSLLLIVVAIRFAPSVFGAKATEYLSISIGLGIDKLAQLLKEKTDLLGQKKPDETN